MKDLEQTETVYNVEDPTKTDQSILIKHGIRKHHKLRQSFQEKLLRYLSTLNSTAETLSGPRGWVDVLTTAGLVTGLDVSHEYAWEFSPLVKMHQRNYNALLLGAQGDVAMVRSRSVRPLSEF